MSEKKYVRLIDYLDKPELIQHKDGRLVRAVHHFPNCAPGYRIVVVLEDGSSDTYYEDGRFISGNIHRFFILRPKPKRKIIGWRKDILLDDGSIFTTACFAPTKEDFERIWSNRVLIGEWQKYEAEIDGE
jgi:hypothetical protein